MRAAHHSHQRKHGGFLKGAAWGCGAILVIVLVVVVGFITVLTTRMPKRFEPLPNPLTRSGSERKLGGGLAGFDSPYLGHTGSWDGQGGGMFGSSKNHDLDAEASMHLRWTFMPVYWRALEPEGPVDLTRTAPPAWQALDAFVIAAHQRKLNILMQAPVMGGNAGGPPAWAGRREKGKSAPANFEAAAAFAGKLAARYKPGGELAVKQGWGEKYGVRAWELDNEPDGYLTHWKDQAGDYAEFATRTAAAIRQTDPQAVMVGPGAMGGGHAPAWVEGALDAQALRGSPVFRQAGVPYSLGPVVDVVSFHIYEGLDSAFSRQERTVETAFGEMRALFERWENRAPGFNYARKTEYWHTEGNFDFFGVLSPARRAAWRMQFFTRSFAAGVSKVMVMDALVPEQAAVRAYVDTLPNPFPMQLAINQVNVLSGQPAVYRHDDRSAVQAGRVWVVWAKAATGDAEIEIPTVRDTVKTITVEGAITKQQTVNQHVRLRLPGDRKMAPVFLVADRP